MKVVWVNIIRALLWSAAIVALLMAGQVTLQSFVRILGQDMTALGDGVLKYYPSIAFSEALKIWLFMTGLLAPAVFFYRAIWSADRPRPSMKRTLAIKATALVGFFFVTFASFLKFPALYESYAPEFINRIIFYCSSFVAPSTLQLLSAGFFIASIALAISVRDLLRPRVIAWSIMAIAVGGLLAANPTDRGQYTNDSDRPNILFIAVDSLRFDRIGDPKIMPRVSALLDAPTTVFFKDHHVGIPRTFPSWVEILTGNYGAQTGIRHMFPGLLDLRKHAKTLPKILNSLGYRTSVVSDFAGDIFPRFDSGIQAVKTPMMTLATMIEMNVDMMFPLFFPALLTNWGRTLFPSLDESPSFADPDWLSTRAIADLHSTSNQPFYTTVFFSTAHFPYAAPWPYYSANSDSNYSGPFKFQKNPDISGKGEVSADDIRQVHALYDGSLIAIDRAIGRILDELANQGVLDHTLLIITADHGEDLFDSGPIHGHGEHLIGNTVLHVPLIMKLPAGSAVKNREIVSLSRSIDIAPTILDYLGQDSSSMRGISQLQAITGEGDTSAPEGAYSETGIWFSNKGNSHFQKQRIDYPSISQLLSFDPGGTKEVVLNEKFESVIASSKHRSLILGDYKLVYMPTAEKIVYKLFNRKNDPDNTIDISDTEPETFAKMKSKLLDTINSIEGPGHLVREYVVKQ